MREKKKTSWQGLFFIGFLLISPGALSSKVVLEEVDIVERISSLLGPGGGKALVEIGNLDIDNDGDIDVLVEAHNKKQVRERGRWTVYFNQGDRYFYAGLQSRFPIYRENIAFRRIEQSDGNRALVWYDPDTEGFFRAYWYEKGPNGSYRIKSGGGSKAYLLKPKEDEIVGGSVDKWKNMGLKIEDLLMNYNRYSSHETLREDLEEKYD